MAIVLVALILLVGCGRTELQTKGINPAGLPDDALTVNVTGKSGGEIITATTSEPDTFNPIVAVESDAQAFNQLMGAGLTRLNLKTQQPEPSLAKSWETSPDQLVWTFHLRQNVNWSDGIPFTADDVLFTMQIVNDPKIASGAQDVLTIGDQKIQWQRKDDHTVIATLPSAYAPFLRFIDAGTVPILPKHKWQQPYEQGKFQQVMQLDMNPADYVCLGAFRLKEYKQGERITLQRNPHFWKKDSQGNRLPYLEEITFLVFPGQDQLLLRMQNGEIDTYQSIRPQDVESLQQRTALTNLEVIRLGPSYENEQFFFNQNPGKDAKTGKFFVDPVKRSWFADVNFRKAVSYAVDRNAIVKNALYGRASVAFGPESPSNHLWYCDQITKYGYDPQRSLDLLNKSGFVMKEGRMYDKTGHPVRFSLHTNAGNTTRNAQCVLIVKDLAKIGIVVDYSPLDFGTLVDKVTNTFDYDAALLSLTHDDVDPATMMHIWMSNGIMHFWRPNQTSPATEWEKRIDELMKMQMSTFDHGKRQTYFNEVQQIIAEQQPMIFTANQYLHACAKSTIGNMKPVVGRHRTLWNAEELYWK
jgi:peptide/nickel transport system substrate-binding protein